MKDRHIHRLVRYNFIIDFNLGVIQLVEIIVEGNDTLNIEVEVHEEKEFNENGCEAA